MKWVAELLAGTHLQYTDWGFCRRWWAVCELHGAAVERYQDGESEWDVGAVDEGGGGDVDGGGYGGDCGVYGVEAAVTLSMTIKYALTRAEIARSFFRSLASSPKFLAMILIYSVALGIFSLVARGALSRSPTRQDGITALAWMVGAFVFMLAWLFIRGKTDERILTISPEGIATEIGALKGQLPWSKIKLVTETNRHVLIVGATGNAFFIPSRAFKAPGQQAEFAS